MYYYFIYFFVSNLEYTKTHYKRFSYQYGGQLPLFLHQIEDVFFLLSRNCFIKKCWQNWAVQNSYWILGYRSNRPLMVDTQYMKGIYYIQIVYTYICGTYLGDFVWIHTTLSSFVLYIFRVQYSTFLVRQLKTDTAARPLYTWAVFPFHPSSSDAVLWSISCNSCQP